MNEPPWLSGAIDALRRLGDRLPHALLIHGPPGWGEEQVANALALELMGLAPGKDAREVAHPDLRWLQGEDGVIRVDDVRRVVEFLQQTPQAAGRKIAVIETADRMNPNAANALLKSLEEPPPESFVALTTSAPERLLPTIRSRCQRIAVTKGDARDVEAWFARVGVDAALAARLAVEYGGAPFSIKAAAERRQTPLWESLRKAGRSPVAVPAVADALREDELVDLLERWLRVLHWLLRSNVGMRTDALEFAQELSHTRRAAMVNTGLNRPMQLQRLLLLWSDLWRGVGMPATEPTAVS